jgi:hypothetical protein
MKKLTCDSGDLALPTFDSSATPSVEHSYHELTTTVCYFKSMFETKAQGGTAIFFFDESGVTKMLDET